MTKNLGDLLRAKQPREPEEFALIRAFVRDKFNADCKLQLQNGQIIISVSSSALAGSLQFELHTLEEQLGSNKKLRLRIG